MIAKYIACILILLPIVQASALGIFPVNDSFIVKPFNKFKYTFYLFNPSEKDTEVDIDFKCYWGNEIYNYTTVFPKKIIIPKNTNMTESKIILVIIKNPVFFKDFVFLNNLKIWYFKPLINEKILNCKLFAKTEEQTNLILTANLEGKVIGLNLTKILIILVLFFVFFFRRFLFNFLKNKNSK
ncbi:MAG: hypothetical protein QXJ06_00155 [Candidatus Aenigmatarchaeota archaeon]